MITKPGNKGFSLIELLLILVLVGIIGFTGFYVWHARNKSNDSLDKASAANSTPSTSNSQEKWLTFSDKDPANSGYAGAAAGGDNVPISFKYPSSWKTAPVGTMITRDDQQIGSGDNLLIPKGLSVNSTTMSFTTFALEKSQTAEENFKESTAPLPGQVGANWESVSTFKTKNGYSGHIGKLPGTTTRYQISVSNTKAIASFGYSSTESKYAPTLKKIVDSVQFLD